MVHGNDQRGTVLRRPALKWALVLGFWTFIALSFACQFHISSAQAGLEVSWTRAIGYSLADWYVFAVLSAPVVRLARIFNFEAGARWRSVLTHVAGSAVFSLSYIILRAWVGSWQSGAAYSEAVQPLLVKTWHFNVLLYWVIIAVTFAFDYHRKYREREWRAAELEKLLAQARLQMLQMQLNPHFFFNSLHSIAALMRQDLEAAERMIAKLGELLRVSLNNTNTQEVALGRELEFLRAYLELEQIRFGERLSVQIEAEPETLAAQVPNLILQPLVENAIRHGVEPHARQGRIELRANNSGNALILQVRDNGRGLSEAGKPEGIGLSNTRARLKTLYGDAQQMQMLSTPDGGLLVRLMIPFHTVPS